MYPDFSLITDFFPVVIASGVTGAILLMVSILMFFGARSVSMNVYVVISTFTKIIYDLMVTHIIM